MLAAQFGVVEGKPTVPRAELTAICKLPEVQALVPRAKADHLYVDASYVVDGLGAQLAPESHRDLWIAARAWASSG